MPTPAFSVPAVQAYMRNHRIDAWLVYDFRGSNSVLDLLLPGRKHSTRRAGLYIPAEGDAVIIHSPLDDACFKDAPFAREQFLGWNDWRNWLFARFAGKRRVAMEYSPGCMLPVISIVDAGAIELVRSLGVEVVSSADLVQVCLAVWTRDALEGHLRASHLVTQAKDAGFDLISQSLKKGKTIDEYTVQQHIMQCFKDSGLETYDPPIVGVNAHAADPHFEVSPTGSLPIRPGDWVLIDLWARLPGDHNIFSDITWVGYCGDKVPTRQREVYGAVKGARDAALALAKRAWNNKQRLEGWQLDDAARAVIIEAGFERAIKHRTGHSLSPGKTAHGIGVNLDNMETHDTREVMPGVGYTIEPGIYLPNEKLEGRTGIGVRLEINVYTDPKTGPRVTSCIQDEPLLLG